MRGSLPKSRGIRLLVLTKRDESRMPQVIVRRPFRRIRIGQQDGLQPQCRMPDYAACIFSSILEMTQANPCRPGPSQTGHRLLLANGLVALAFQYLIRHHDQTLDRLLTQVMTEGKPVAYQHAVWASMPRVPAVSTTIFELYLQLFCSVQLALHCREPYQLLR